MKTFKYNCAYCNKKYKIEKYFLAHECPTKARIDRSKTALGQRAYELYCRFMEIKFNNVPPLETFIESSYYKACFEFIPFSEKVGLVDIDIYLKVMSSKGLTPSEWTDPLSYSYYIDNIDKFIKPEKQIEISVTTILDFCEMVGVDTSEFFDLITPADLVEMITSRELSPWLILNSSKFMEFYKNELSNHFKKLVSELIDGKTWNSKLKINPNIRATAKECVKELML